MALLGKGTVKVNKEARGPIKVKNEVKMRENTTQSKGN
jgi:hypothetical protein